MQSLYYFNEWEFRLPDGVYNINGGHLTADIELFFSEDEMRQLFDCPRKVYHRICQFAAGTLTPSDKTQLDKEQTVASLELFNYLSEIDSARNALYGVCAASTDNGAEFKEKFPTNH